MKLFLAMMRHMLIVSLINLAALTILAVIRIYIDGWFFLVLFFVYGIFVFMPSIFGIGPIGRFVGKRFNDTAIAEDEEYRKSFRSEIEEEQQDKKNRIK